MLACSPPPSIVSFADMAASLSEVHQAHALMLKTGLIHDTFAASRIIAAVTIATPATAVSGSIDYAHSVFNRINNPNSYTWNTLIRAYADGATPEGALILFCEMLHGTIFPDKFTFPFVLKACSSLCAIEEGRQIHAFVVKIGLFYDVFIQNSLIHLYASLGYFERALVLLDRMVERDVISWNAILSACVRWGLIEQAQKLFEEMPVRNVESWNFMISGYAGVGLLEEARSLFDEMPVRDVVSWNSMITGYARVNRFIDVLNVFEDMQQTANVKPDGYTLVNVLSACANLGALSQGEWVHAYMDKNGIQIDGFLATSLIDMYSKCGSIKRALLVFRTNSKKDVSTWNSLIAGLSSHGHSRQALKMFFEMLSNGFAPNEVTFVSILNACCHAGMLDEGRQVFNLMVEVYGMEPTAKHYGCLVDLLGRAGRLEEAEKLVQTMPFKDDPVVWETLLGACISHGNVEMAERVGRKLIELNPCDAYGYVQLSNLYATLGRWNHVREMRRKMRVQNVRKEPGCSMIEVDGVVHEFLAGEGLLDK